jgi:hypothetical protein
MRIERLARENARTQGPERRAWYRRHSPEHLRALEALVAAALVARKPSAPSTAAVLGAGACTELPLERIARACERVTLVDLDAAGMGHARDEELSPALRPRMELLAADLTGGVSAALSARLRAQPWADLAALGGPQGSAPLDAAADCLERCPIADPPQIAGLAPGGYGLVVSSLTLTQLFSLPLLDVLDTLNFHAPGAADLRETSLRYQAAARGFRRRIAQAHLSLIAALLAPGGAALLTSDVTGYLLAPGSGPHRGSADEAFEMLPRAVLDLAADLAPRFERVGEPRRWRWLVSAPAGGMPGRAYDAMGIVLRPRRDDLLQ